MKKPIFDVLYVFVAPVVFLGLLAGFSAGLLLGSFIWNLPGWMIPVLVVTTMFSMLGIMWRSVKILASFRMLFGQQELTLCEDGEMNKVLNKFLRCDHCKETFLAKDVKLSEPADNITTLIHGLSFPWTKRD